MKFLNHHNHNHNHHPDIIPIIITNLFTYSSITILLLSLILLIPSKSVLCINNEYYPEERDALLTLRESLTSNLINLHAKWTGPPCHKNDTNWIGVVCLESHVVSVSLDDLNLTGSLHTTPFQNVTRLTKLTLSNNSLSGPLPNLTALERLEHVSFRRNAFEGPIPPELAHLPRLRTLELQHNRLSGEIPPFDQPSLTVFNVSDNRLYGRIPDTPILRGLPASCFEGNPGLCGEPLEAEACGFRPAAPPPSPGGLRKKGRRLGVVAMGLIAGFVPVLVILGFLFYYRVVHGKEKVAKEILAEKRSDMESPKSSRSKDPERGVDLEFFDKEIAVFDLDDLLRSSAEVLGKGALGTTYKTTLETGQSLAVKRLKDMNELSKKEFVQQMQLLGKTCCRHENLVKIVSFYYSKDEKLVVYEFVPDGTLFELLHEKRGVDREPLTWETRVSIIKDIAKGLTFLHQSLPHHKVPHANLKSSNVLIQRNANTFLSKLTDFGFFADYSKLAVARSPEHAQGKRLSRNSDTYCFGIIILEIITGRIPSEISPATEKGTEDLSSWVRMVVDADWSTDILDVEIAAAREGHDEMLKLTEIALQCTHVVPEKRPKMSEVLRRIEEIHEQCHRENE